MWRPDNEPVRVKMVNFLQSKPLSCGNDYYSSR